MTETLLLKTNEEPSFWNKEAAIGFFIAPVLGTIIGGFIGKERMKKEKELGKPVSSEPGFWNKDTALGGLIGTWLGAAAAVVLQAISVGYTVAAVGTGAAAVAIPPVAVAAAIGALVSIVAGPVLGAYIGGRSGQEDEHKEYLKAKQQQLEQARTREPEVEQTAGRSFVQRIEQERVLAAAQQPTR